MAPGLKCGSHNSKVRYPGRIWIQNLIVYFPADMCTSFAMALTAMLGIRGGRQSRRDLVRKLEI